MKITFIGGGSYLWVLGFSKQIIESEYLKNSRICLMDIDKSAVELVSKAVGVVNKQAGSPAKIEATMDMERALDGADYVIVSISTGGLEAMRADIEIPEKYNIWQTVGDTVGPGGWSRAVRNVYVFDGIAAAMKRLCPNAWMINVSNPLTVLTRVPQRNYGIKTIGLCPSADGCCLAYSRIAGYGDKNVDFVVTGVDHAAWYTKIIVNGKHDVIKKLKEMGLYATKDLPTTFKEEDPMAETQWFRAAFAIWRDVGYLPTVGDRHVVEDFPWFNLRPTPEIPYGVKRTSTEDRINSKEKRRNQLEEFAKTGDIAVMGGLGHGMDPDGPIIESLSGNRSMMYALDYMNIGQTPELPMGAVVETRCRIDALGIHPLASPMPELLKIYILPIVLRQEAIIPIAMHGTFDELVTLVQSDPLCSRLEMGQCREMMRQMLEANRSYIKNPKLLEF